MDHEAVSYLEADLDESADRASEDALCLAAAFCWHIKELDDGRKYCEMVLSRDSSNQEASILLGWINCSGASTSSMKARKLLKYVTSIRHTYIYICIYILFESNCSVARNRFFV